MLPVHYFNIEIIHTSKASRKNRRIQELSSKFKLCLLKSSPSQGVLTLQQCAELAHTLAYADTEA